MPLTKDEFLKRARRRSEELGDWWDWIAGMVENRPGIGITDRRHYNQKQWAELHRAKEQVIEAWE